MTKCETCGKENFNKKRFIEIKEGKYRKEYWVGGHKTYRAVYLAVENWLAMLQDEYEKDCHMSFVDGSKDTKQAALTLLADEGFCERLAIEFMYQTWQKLDWTNEQVTNLWNLGTADAVKEKYREIAKQAIRKAANLQEERKCNCLMIDGFHENYCKESDTYKQNMKSEG